MNGEESYVDDSAGSKYENAKSLTKGGVNGLDTSSNANLIKALVKTLWWTYLWIDCMNYDCKHCVNIFYENHCLLMVHEKIKQMIKYLVI